MSFTCLHPHVGIDAQLRCQGPIGIYFLVKRCSLLYLYANNGTFSQSPYLDIHGEVDVSMRFVRVHVMRSRAHA